MDMTLHQTLLPHDDPDASLALYRDTLGFEVPNEVEYGDINMAATDLDGTFERLQAGDADVVQQPTDQPNGIGDCAFRDPAGNLTRLKVSR